METNISEKLAELMDTHGLSDEKLAHATNVPLRFIDALKNGEFSKLPAEPYVRGYLLKIAKTLKADPDELMSAYKESTSSSKSGQYDKLPSNRFQKIVLARGAVVGIAIILIIGAFFFFRFDEILGLTDLNVNVPKTTSEQLLTITGSAQPGDRITLNDEIVYTDEVGNFEKDIMLVPGINNLEFKVKRFLGRERIITKQIFFEPVKDTNIQMDTNETNNTNGF